MAAEYHRRRGPVNGQVGLTANQFLRGRPTDRSQQERRHRGSLPGRRRSGGGRRPCGRGGGPQGDAEVGGRPRRPPDHAALARDRREGGQGPRVHALARENPLGGTYCHPLHAASPAPHCVSSPEPPAAETMTLPLFQRVVASNAIVTSPRRRSGVQNLICHLRPLFVSGLQLLRPAPGGGGASMPRFSNLAAAEGSRRRRPRPVSPAGAVGISISMA